MKKNIHPTYYNDAQVICACGNTWTTGSTKKVIHTDVCYKCHPFYTGEQRIVDTEGRVERFNRKMKAKEQYSAEKIAREAARVSPERPLVEFGLGKRAIDALADAGIKNAGDVLAKLEQGEDTLLEISGFGRKSLADLKKAMRQFGYELPETA